ncbi:MAG TPA: hypothetical protein VFO10_31180 [Oligoflexus sp.]|uniref:hypothetical protein n=1 Tax=Oligoflexus sp. TaxID=1971216 RepID=UPI002D7F37FC|nr:hypothetical protein [Oligoflexus sp.]HET9241773.1 hypothetical protein [Oligoflexus sp.]
MWRFLAVLFGLSLSSLSMADERSKPVIENFFHDPVPLLGVGEDSVSVRFHWRANVKSCQLVMQEQLIDVSSVTTATVNIPESMEVRLRCGTAEALTHIPLRKKVSIMSLTVEASGTEKIIRWDAFGAVSCRIQDQAKQLDVSDQPAQGQYLLKDAVPSISIQLSCEDAQGRWASARASGFSQVNRGQNLWAKASQPKKK